MIEFVHIAHAASEAAAVEAETGVLGTLGINWKLFLAQLLNFSIVLFVLNRYVFTPVGKKLEERRLKIEKALQDAEDIEKEKQEFEKWKNEAVAAANKKASEIVLLAQDEASKEKAEALLKTKQEQEQVVRQAKDKIEEEKKKSIQEAKGEIAGMVTTATEKILMEKITDKKDKELIEKTVKSITA